MDQDVFKMTSGGREHYIILFRAERSRGIYPPPFHPCIFFVLLLPAFWKLPSSLSSRMRVLELSTVSWLWCRSKHWTFSTFYLSFFSRQLKIRLFFFLVLLPAVCAKSKCGKSCYYYYVNFDDGIVNFSLEVDENLTVCLQDLVSFVSLGSRCLNTWRLETGDSRVTIWYDSNYFLPLFQYRYQYSCHKGRSWLGYMEWRVVEG